MSIKSGSLFENDSVMLINVDNVVRYLVDRGLLDTKSIIEGDLRVVDASRRNRNFQIIRRNDASLLMKQPNTFDANNITTVKKEALLYLLMQTEPDFMALKDMSPRILDFDDQNNILMTEFIANAQSLNNYNYFSSRGILRKEDYVELGRLVATYHKAFREKVSVIMNKSSSSIDNNNNNTKSKLRFLQDGFVPAASIVRPGPEIFRDISSANLKLLKVVQQYPTLYESLEELYSGWRRETLIHGDIKWDNVIISPKEGNNGSGFKMNIVDWESASIGDPAWDIGSIFQEFLKFWLYFLPTTGRESAEQLITSTSYPISNIQPAIRAFWSAYAKNSGIGGREANELLIRSTKFCAARLVQSAYESLYSSAEFPNTIVYMIQTSLNIFHRTNNAIIQLLGIPFRSEWSQ